VNIEAKAPYFPRVSAIASEIPIRCRVVDVFVFVDELDLLNPELGVFLEQASNQRTFEQSPIYGGGQKRKKHNTG
jgi:hypothetical protein